MSDNNDLEETRGSKRIVDRKVRAIYRKIRAERVEVRKAVQIPVPKQPYKYRYVQGTDYDRHVAYLKEHAEIRIAAARNRLALCEKEYELAKDAYDRKRALKQVERAQKRIYALTVQLEQTIKDYTRNHANARPSLPPLPY